MARTTKKDVTQGEMVAHELNVDEGFRQDWEKHAPARMVAAKLIEYRFDNDLSQRALADLLGVKQPQVARWESGESLPAAGNLALIAAKLDIEIVLSFARADREPKKITSSTRKRAASYSEAGAVVRFAAG